MAFRPRLASTPDSSDDGPLPRFETHPEAARLLGIARAIRDAMAERQRGLDLLAIEGELARPTSGSGTGPRAQMMRERAARLRAQVQPPKADTPKADGLPPAVSRALALLQGETVAEEPDRGVRIQRLREELRILDAASRPVEEMISELRAEESRKAALALVRRHRSILLSVYEAAAALSAAVEAERALYAEPLMAGYDGRPDILARPALDGASRLGRLDDFDSQIAHFRRRLEAQGVL